MKYGTVRPAKMQTVASEGFHSRRARRERRRLSTQAGWIGESDDDDDDDDGDDRNYGSVEKATKLVIRLCRRA